MNNSSIKTGNLYDKEIIRQLYQQEIAVMFKIVRIPSKLNLSSIPYKTSSFSTTTSIFKFSWYL